MHKLADFISLLDAIAGRFGRLQENYRPNFAAIIDLAAEIADATPEDAASLLCVLQRRVADVRKRPTMKNGH